LYDNQNDPLQINNLASDPEWAEKLAGLRSGMAVKMQQINDEFRPCTWYRDHWMDPEDQYSITGAAKGSFTGPYRSISSVRSQQ